MPTAFGEVHRAIDAFSDKPVDTPCLSISCAARSLPSRPSGWRRPLPGQVLTRRDTHGLAEHGDEAAGAFVAHPLGHLLHGDAGAQPLYGE